MDVVTLLIDRFSEARGDVSHAFVRDLETLGSFDAPLGIAKGLELDLRKARIINGYDFSLTKYSLGKNKIGFHLAGTPDMAPGNDSIFVGIDCFWWKFSLKKVRGLELSILVLELFAKLGGYKAEIRSSEWDNRVIDHHAKVREARGFWFHPDSKYHQIGIAPAHVWSDLFCRRAFGKTSREIAERVRPVAKAVHLDEDGNVQIAFLDMDADVPQILEMNERVRPLIGGYGMFAPFPDDCSGIEGVTTEAPDAERKRETTMKESELDSMAQAYLEALGQGCDIEGGVLEAEALSRLALDYSLGSLDALDALLLSIASSRNASERGITRQDVQNLSFLVGFYAGATLAKARGERPVWKLHAEIAREDPAFARQVPAAFETYIVCCIGADRFFPLVAVRHLLEQGAASTKRLRSSVEAFV